MTNESAVETAVNTKYELLADDTIENVWNGREYVTLHRIKATVEILAMLGRKSQVVPLGPDLATADDVIAGHARYADTPGGHADRKTLRGERAVIIHLVYPDGPSLTAACGQSIDGRGHTGHYAADVKRDLRWGRDVCLACVQLLETP